MNDLQQKLRTWTYGGDYGHSVPEDVAVPTGPDGFGTLRVPLFKNGEQINSIKVEYRRQNGVVTLGDTFLPCYPTFEDLSAPSTFVADEPDMMAECQALYENFLSQLAIFEEGRAAYERAQEISRLVSEKCNGQWPFEKNLPDVDFEPSNY